MRKKGWKVVRVISLGFFLLLILACVLLGIWAENIPHQVQDTAQYEEILAEYDGGPEVVAHFPSHIPENATDVTFDYRGAFFQAGSSLLLSYKLPASDIQAIADHYRPIAQKIADGRSPSIPEGYDVFYLHDLDAPVHKRFAYGIAISLEHQKVVYFVEDMRT